jgi:alpha-mannosidase
VANVIAWGNDTDRIGNRADSAARPWPKSFDQRLRGTHLIEYALYPHPGTWADADVTQASRSYQAPLLARETGRHGGVLPPRHGLMSLGPSSLVVTAVLPSEARSSENGFTLRLYESAGRETRPEVRGRFRLLDLVALDGRAIQSLRPFQIAHARCVPV